MDVIRVGVLTVSDRASRGEVEDVSGPVIVELIESHLPHGEIADRSIVPDDVDAIQAVLRRWADQDGLHLILTSGGTGLAPRDRTPEATKPLLDREAPGIVVAMLRESLGITPYAMLSRPAAGMRGQTLIVNLPGSPKAVRENLETILPALPHGIELLCEVPEASEDHTPPAD